MVKEKIIHRQICDYINMQYPHAIFTSDSSGARVSIGLRNEFKRKRCRMFKILDIIILQPNKHYQGLMLEVKSSKDELFKKDGTFKKNEHIKEQKRSIDRLNAVGYYACFVCGLYDAIEVIKKYMSDGKFN